MEIGKIIGIGLIAVILIMVIKQYRPEFAIYLSLITGVILLSMVISRVSQIVEILENLAEKSSFHSKFIWLLLKITGIALLTEFAVSISKDAGENAIASKIDLVGKVMVISLAIPILTSLVETITNILP